MSWRRLEPSSARILEANEENHFLECITIEMRFKVKLEEEKKIAKNIKVLVFFPELHNIFFVLQANPHVFSSLLIISSERVSRAQTTSIEFQEKKHNDFYFSPLASEAAQNDEECYIHLRKGSFHRAAQPRKPRPERISKRKTIEILRKEEKNLRSFNISWWIQSMLLLYWLHNLTKFLLWFIKMMIRQRKYWSMKRNSAGV